MASDDTGVSPAGLYVHVPFCDGKCAYCSFFSTIYHQDVCERFLNALDAEACFTTFSPETIYLGGGTPTVLEPDQLAQLCGIVCSRFDLTRVKEWTVEANPGSLTGAKLDILKNAGVTRVSVGCQSFNQDVLDFLGRRHTVCSAIDSLYSVREHGFENISADLIACVPGFDMQIWRHTLETVIGAGVEHVSVYALTADEGSLLYERVGKKEFELLSEAEELSCIALAGETLGAAGYRRYEISNYAIEGRECLHNLACWQGYGYVGLGPAASSYTGTSRRTNDPDLERYVDALKNRRAPPRFEETISSETKAVEKIVFGLRMIDGVTDDTGAGFRKALSRLEEQGLVVREKERWRLTEQGLNLADYVAVELMP